MNLLKRAVGRPPRLATLACCLLLGLLWSGPVHAAALDPNQVVELVSPAPGSMAIEKKPTLEINLPGAAAANDLIIILDDNDITGLVEHIGGKLQVPLFEILPSGEHVLTVITTDNQGNQTEHSYTFRSKHYEDYDEAFVSGDLSAVWEGAFVRNNADDWPDSNIEANLENHMRVKRGNWDISFDSNLRYQDQSKALTEPEKKGINIADYLLRAAYDQDGVSLDASMGDVIVDLGRLTVDNLARRGGLFQADAGGASATLFMVNSNEYWGFYGGMGLDGDTSDHLMGGRVSVDIVPEIFKAGVHYVTGGQEGDSFGEWSDEASGKGDVWGARLWAGPWGEVLTAEAELNFSSVEYENNSNDADDKAWRVALEGQTGAYTYNAGYEYIGPDYNVAANDSFENDRQGYNIGGRGDWTNHSLAANFGQYQDNVDADADEAKTNSIDAGLNYSYNGLERWPLTLSYQLATLDTCDEPSWVEAQETRQHTVLGTASYLGDILNLGLQAEYSNLDDGQTDSYDSRTMTFTLSPALLYENLSISPSFSWSQMEMTASSITTDTLTINMDILGQLPEWDVNWQLAGSYNKTKASDESSDLEIIGVEAEISRSLGQLLGGHLRPTVALRAQYNNNRDLALDDSEEEFIALVVLSADAPFSF